MNVFPYNIRLYSFTRILYWVVCHAFQPLIFWDALAVSFFYQNDPIATQNVVASTRTTGAPSACARNENRGEQIITTLYQLATTDNIINISRRSCRYATWLEIFYKPNTMDGAGLLPQRRRTHTCFSNHWLVQW